MSTPTFPVFNWLPPLWGTTKPNFTTDPFNQPNLPVFHPGALEGDIALAPDLAALKARFPDTIDHVNGSRTVEQAVDGDQAPIPAMVPHPKSDFSHVDKDNFTDDTEDPRNDELGKFRSAIAAVEALEDLAAKDGTMEETIEEALVPLRKAGALIAPIPRGRKRLSLIFENNLCKLTVLYGRMNDALEMADQIDGKVAYNQARQDYMDLLKDLDDPEPRAITPGIRGYGRALKWIYVRPIIHGGKIKGAQIVAKWNPHMSSSGIPVPHG